jgi:Tfp pilus assembly protein FimT
MNGYSLVELLITLAFISLFAVAILAKENQAISEARHALNLSLAAAQLGNGAAIFSIADTSREQRRYLDDWQTLNRELLNGSGDVSCDSLACQGYLKWRDNRGSNTLKMDRVK